MGKKFRPIDMSTSKMFIACSYLFFMFFPLILFLIEKEFYLFALIFSIIFFIVPIVPTVRTYLKAIKITFNKEQIEFLQKVNNGNSKNRFNKCKILYFNIEYVKLVFSYKDTDKKVILDENDKEVKNINLYLEFILKNEDSMWFDISPYSDKQREKIISQINRMTDLTKSYNQLVRELLMPQMDGKVILK